MILAWRPWLTWGVAAMLFFYAFFLRVSPSVMIDPLMRDLGVGAAVLGNLSAFYFYAYAGLQIPVGLTLDRWGPRRVLSIAAAFAALGSLCFAAAETILLIYLGRLMIGAGCAFGFVGSLKLASVWFPTDRFARLSGMTLMLGMFGGILGQGPLAYVVEAVGWRPALAAAGLAGGGLSLAIWLVVRDRPAHHPAPDPAAPRPRVLAALGRVLGRPQNWALACVGAATTAPLLAFAGLWGVAWLMQVHGMARPRAAATASLLLIGWALGSPLAGALSDRLGRRKPLLMAAAGGGMVCLGALLYLPGLSLAVLSALFLISGLFLGGMVVSFALARESNDAAVSGLAMAFVNMAVTGTGALFQPLIGILLDLGWDGAMVEGARVYSAAAYRAAFSVLMVFLAAGLAVSFTTRESGATLRA